MNWQPIETAPRDGTQILALWVKEDGKVRGVCEVCWESGNEWYSARWHPIYLSQHGCDCCSSDLDSPSHWMPLPEPPK